MNFLQPVEKPLILAVNVVRVLSGGKLQVHGMVLFVLGHAFFVEGDAATRRGGGKPAPHRPVRLSDLLQAALVLVLRAIEANT